MEIGYIGEHLWIGKAGNAFVVFSFAAALLACISFFKATAKPGGSWHWIGKQAFRVHSIAVLTIVGLLFFMLGNHYFEYHWVWQHTNFEMPGRYLFSAFWEGQEGSFLLWTFWHVVIGNILIFTAKKWVNPVMTVFSSAQVFLASMILGVYILEYRLGSNPFTELLRDHPDFANLPLFASANYLENLDGRGLNPLLQNYWMTIHPPTLFLGFALTLVPFSFAVAGLWKRDYHGWIKPALPWTYLGIGILGTGILMGGAWAYEALSFGGFWAWDPVENASLVPWIVLVGSAHLMLIHKNKGTSLVAMFGLTLLSFILILYSTFLTRSGVLGDTSVHSFTDMGMSGQLLVYLFFYLTLSLGLLIWRYRDFPRTDQDEPLWSREFWMFVGALVLTISAFQISFTTSIPVINKIFGTDMAPPADPVDHYNSWQLPFAVIILVIVAFGQFLKYKRNSFAVFLKKIFISLASALILTVVLGLTLNMGNPYFLVMLFAALFAILGNLHYFFSVMRGKVKKAGASVAHVGFGLLMLGALLSMSGSDVISSNTSGVDISQLGEEFSNNENILLMEGDTLPMGNYHVTYKGREKDGIYVRYEVEYLKKDQHGQYSNAFTLKPFVQLNERMGNVPEPDTKHYLIEDIYTHVTYATLKDRSEQKQEYEKTSTENMQVGDTAFANNAILVLENIFRGTGNRKIELKDNDLAVTARYRVFDFNTQSHILEPVFVLRDSAYVVSEPAELPELGIRLDFKNVDTQTGEVEVDIFESEAAKKDFIIMKAIVFPYINLLWLGCIVMVIGTFIAVINRFQRWRDS